MIEPLSRRKFFSALPLLPVLGIWSSPRVRVIPPRQMSRDCEVESIGDGKCRWKFQHYALQEGDLPLQIGEHVYFDGTPFAAPTVDGTVTLLSSDDPFFPGIQNVTVQGSI